MVQHAVNHHVHADAQVLVEYRLTNFMTAMEKVPDVCIGIDAYADKYKAVKDSIIAGFFIHDVLISVGQKLVCCSRHHNKKGIVGYTAQQLLCVPTVRIADTAALPSHCTALYSEHAAQSFVKQL